MSFYKRSNPSMGFVWLAPVVQLVGGALQTQPLNSNIYAAPRANPFLVAAGVIGGLGLVGGIIYFAWKS